MMSSNMSLNYIEFTTRADGTPVACIGACGPVDSVLGHCWSFEEENLSDDWNEGVEQIRILERMLGT